VQPEKYFARFALAEHGIAKGVHSIGFVVHGSLVEHGSWFYGSYFTVHGSWFMVHGS
jgi:hypothetical protein